MLPIQSKPLMLPLLLIPLALLAIWLIYSIAVSAFEAQPYTVVENRKGYEIREYPAHIRAEITLPYSGEKPDMSEAFRILFAYIDSGNETKNKIPMTTPVYINNDITQKTYTMSFVMPKDYTLSTTPRPTDNRISLRAVPTRKIASLSFSYWYATQARSERAKKRLLEKLQQDNIQTLSTPIVAVHNTPTVIPLIMCNEALVEVE